MNHFLNPRGLIFFVTLLLLFSLVAIAQANGFSLSRSTVDNGGGTLNNGAFTLTGNIGQPDAGAVLSNGGYTLIGGVFAGAIGPTGEQDIYLPIILRN